MDSEYLTETRNGSLPCELMEDILCLLPVKDLLRFRSVCKAWKTIVDNYRFKKKQFEATKDSNSSLLMWRQIYSPICNTILINFLSPCDSYEVSDPLLLSLGQLFNNKDSLSPADTCPQFWQVGTVNGFVCLFYKSCVVIWNPSTKEFRKIDSPPGKLVHELLASYGFPGSIGTSLCTFGFDPKTEDYKFMIAAFVERGKAAVQIYSLCYNSWKSFAFDFPYVIPRYPGDGFMDGKSYWFVMHIFRVNDGNFGPAIVQFDFSDEKLDFIPLSEELAAASNSIVVTTRGCLELITTFGNPNEDWRCEVWVMAEDRSWNKRLSIVLPSVVESPRGISKDGQIIFNSMPNGKGDRELVLVDPSTGLCKNLGYGSTNFWIFTYTESLFSIKQCIDRGIKNQQLVEGSSNKSAIDQGKLEVPLQAANPSLLKSFTRSQDHLNL